MNSLETLNGVGHSHSSPLLIDEAHPYPALSRLNQLVAERNMGRLLLNSF